MELANMQWPYIKELSSKLSLPYTRRVHLVNYSDPKGWFISLFNNMWIGRCVARA